MNYIETSKHSLGSPARIYYNDFGQGKPIILIHGWPMSNEMWEYQIPTLVNSGHRVIAYDRRGFGKSSQPWNGYDYDTLADDLKAIIDALNLKDITLIGFSMGGGEIVRYFSRCGGKNVTKVVLISSVTPYLLQTTNNKSGVNQSVFDDMIEKIGQDRIGFLDDFVKTFFGLSYLNKPSPRLDYYRSLCAVASPRATIECAKAFATTDFRDEMKMIDVPTLIIHGDADKTVPIDSTGKESAKYILDNNFKIYEGAPHGLFYTEKEKLNDDLLSFIEDKRLSYLTNHSSKATNNG